MRRNWLIILWMGLALGNAACALDSGKFSNNNGLPEADFNSQEISLPEFKTRRVPNYPFELKNKGMEGEVPLSVIIDQLGRLKHVAVIRSDHDLFTQAAKEALNYSTFHPAKFRGSPITASIEIPFTFTLDD